MDAASVAHDRQHIHDEAEWRWRKLGQDYPTLAETIAFGRGLVKLYINELPAAGVIALTPDEARAKLAAGVPLLRALAISVTMSTIRPPTTRPITALANVFVSHPTTPPRPPASGWSAAPKTSLWRRCRTSAPWPPRWSPRW